MILANDLVQQRQADECHNRRCTGPRTAEDQSRNCKCVQHKHECEFVGWDGALRLHHPNLQLCDARCKRKLFCKELVRCSPNSMVVGDGDKRNLIHSIPLLQLVESAGNL